MPAASVLIHHPMFHGDCRPVFCMCIERLTVHFACLTVSSLLLTSFLRLGGSSIEQGLFGFLPPMLVDCWFQRCLMNEFAWYFASVGQACNPGPGTDGVRLAVVNPTTGYGKVDRLLGLKADLLAVSETSAACVVQKDCARDFKNAGFKSFWSRPVAAKKSTIDCGPSYRGEAVGSAIFTCLPGCSTRGDIHEPLWETQRFPTCIVRLADLKIWVISLYGFANRYKEGIRPNDFLIASIIPVSLQVGLPFIVAGDFNEPLTKSPAYHFFMALGAVEAFHWYKLKFHEDLPSTCSVQQGMIWFLCIPELPASLRQ